jgi:drug/metabolite transporter (DMT)-like permease
VKDRTALAFAILLAVSAVWGLAFVVIKVLLRVLHPLDLTVWRFLWTGLGFLTAFAWLWFKDRKQLALQRRHIPLFLVLGFLAVPGYHLSLNYGANHTPAGVAALLVGTGPVFIALLAMLFLRERLGPRRVAGILFAFVGTAVIVLGGPNGDALDLDPSRGFVLGALTVLLAPVSWAGYSVLAKRMLKDYSSTALTVYLMFFGTLMVLPALAFPHGSGAVPDLTPRQWAGVAYLGIAAGFLGYVGWNFGVHSMDASRAGAFVYFVPVFAVMWSAILLDEPVTPAIMVGGGLTILGVVIASWNLKKAAVPAEATPSLPTEDVPPN